MQNEADLEVPRVEIELDAQLKADSAGELKGQLLAQLKTEHQAIQKILKDGCSSEDYPLYQGLLSALETAQEIILEVWDRLHRV